MSNPFDRSAGGLEKDFHSWRLLLLPLIWLLGSLLLWRDYRRYAAAEPRQAATLCTITSNQSENHSQYSYKFVVGGHLFTGAGNARNERAIPGDTMSVYYDSHDPTFNVLDENFQAAASSSLGQAEGIFAMTCLAEVALAIGVVSTKRRSAAQLKHLS
jgi:hypothetical protein